MYYPPSTITVDFYLFDTMAVVKIYHWIYYILSYYIGLRIPKLLSRIYRNQTLHHIKNNPILFLLLFLFSALNDESLQGPVPSMGRITGSASIETLVRVGIEKENGLGPESKMVVLHDFTPCVDDELEVKRGQVIYLRKSGRCLLALNCRQESKCSCLCIQ